MLAIIEHAVDIHAAPAVVWDLITQAEGFAKWYAFGGAEIDLSPGGAIVVQWPEHGVFLGVVDRIDTARHFEFRWSMLPDTPPRPGASTRVVITLADIAGGTRATVTEHGFDALDIPDAEAEAYAATNLSAWQAGFETLQSIAPNRKDG